MMQLLRGFNNIAFPHNLTSRPGFATATNLVFLCFILEMKFYNPTVKCNVFHRLACSSPVYGHRIEPYLSQKYFIACNCKYLIDCFYYCSAVAQAV
jgi:hypothetical protein